MSQTNKIFPLLTAFCLTMGALSPAFARDGAEIAKIFDSGVAAYDAGNYPQAFKIWWGLQYEDLAAMRNLAMMLRKGQGVAKDPKKAEEIWPARCPCWRPPPPPIIPSPSSSWENCTRPGRRRWWCRIWKWRASFTPPPPAMA
jgi:hypothetical protein